MAYKVLGIDNRGHEDHPFGFVYLAKGKHIAGRIGYGAHSENKNPLAIWPCHETPDNINVMDVERVRLALAERFPHLAKQEAA